MKIIIAIVFSLIFITGCQKDESRQPSFYPGQMVKMKAFGVKGMVVSAGCFKTGCYYSVRFPSMQMKTNVSLMGADGPVEFSPVSIVQGIRDFELEVMN